jgi:hypothetical protein
MEEARQNASLAEGRARIANEQLKQEETSFFEGWRRKDEIIETWPDVPDDILQEMIPFYALLVRQIMGKIPPIWDAVTIKSRLEKWMEHRKLLEEIRLRHLDKKE